MKKKILLASIVALSLALLVAVGGSIAYLIDVAAPLQNTFAPSDVNIKLTENNNTYKIIPGTTELKNPTVTLEKTDIDSYVFIKVVENNGIVTYTAADNTEKTTKFSDFITYVIADGWKYYQQADGTTVAGVYYREVTANTNGSYTILKCVNTTHTSCDGCVSYPTTITKEMMNALGTNSPTLTFSAAVVQKDNLSVQEAYAQLGW